MRGGREGKRGRRRGGKGVKGEERIQSKQLQVIVQGAIVTFASRKHKQATWLANDMSSA